MPPNLRDYPRCRYGYAELAESGLSLDPTLSIEIMGSYRRGAADSGDVDILITRDTSDGLTHAGVLPRLIHLLQARAVITHDVSQYFGLRL
jgi:DNA polymerase lambda